MSSPSVSSPKKRDSKFIEHMNDKTQEDVDESKDHVEMIERDAMVERSFRQYKANHPKEYNKLNWEASYKHSNAKYVEPSEDNNESRHVSWDEVAMEKLRGEGHTGEKPPTSPVKKSSGGKVAQKIAVAKKALCFGSATPGK